MTLITIEKLTVVSWMSILPKNSSRVKMISSRETVQIGNFKVMAFDVQHDAAASLRVELVLDSNESVQS